MQPFKRRHFAIRRLIKNDLRLGHPFTRFVPNKMSRKYSQICDAFYQKTVSKSMDEGQLKNGALEDDAPPGLRNAKEGSMFVSTVKDTGAATLSRVKPRLVPFIPVCP